MNAFRKLLPISAILSIFAIFFANGPNNPLEEVGMGDLFIPALEKILGPTLLTAGLAWIVFNKIGLEIVSTIFTIQATLHMILAHMISIKLGEGLASWT